MRKNQIATIEQLLTRKQVAGQLAVSEQTVWKLARDGNLPRVNIGGSVRYRQSDVHELMKNGTWT